MPICSVQILSEEVFPFPDMTDFCNNPQTRCFPCQAAPWEGGCCGKQLPEPSWLRAGATRVMGLMEGSSQRVVWFFIISQLGKFTDFGIQVVFLIPSIFSFPLQPPASNSCQVEYLHYGFVIFLLIFHADGTRI